METWREIKPQKSSYCYFLWYLSAMNGMLSFKLEYFRARIVLPLRMWPFPSLLHKYVCVMKFKVLLSSFIFPGVVAKREMFYFKRLLADTRANGMFLLLIIFFFLEVFEKSFFFVQNERKWNPNFIINLLFIRKYPLKDIFGA